MSATVRPAAMPEIDVLEHGALRVVSEGDVLEDDLARTRRQRLCVGRVGDLLRLVEDLEDPLAAAIARCAWPIHIPSMRSGMTSIASRRLNAKNAPSESEPEITMRPATSSTSACATSGRNVSSGT